MDSKDVSVCSCCCRRRDGRVGMDGNTAAAAAAAGRFLVRMLCGVVVAVVAVAGG